MLNAPLKGTVEMLFEHNLEKLVSEDFDSNEAEEDMLLRRVKKMDTVADKLENGKEIQRMILLGSEEQIHNAYLVLYHSKQKYKSNIFKKWICTAGGVLLGVLLSPILI